MVSHRSHHTVGGGNLAPPYGPKAPKNDSSLWVLGGAGFPSIQGKLCRPFLAYPRFLQLHVSSSSASGRVSSKDSSVIAKATRIGVPDFENYDVCMSVQPTLHRTWEKRSQSGRIAMFPTGFCVRPGTLWPLWKPE